MSFTVIKDYETFDMDFVFHNSRPRDACNFQFKTPSNISSTSRLPNAGIRREMAPTAMVVEASHNAVNEEYDNFDEKKISFKRFKRNDILMKEIMSAEIVPSASTPVTSAKLKMLQMQVAALSECQQQEAAELVEVEKNQTAIMARMKQQKEAFDAVYRKLSRPITPVQIKRFSDYVYERLRKRLLERIRQQKDEKQQENEAEQVNGTLPHSDHQDRASVAQAEKRSNEEVNEVHNLETFSHSS